MQSTHSGKSLYMAIEVSNQKWRLAFGDGRQEREIALPARAQERLWEEIKRAKAKLQLPLDAQVYSCYEAGRDGFWIHRMLAAGGVNNLVVDPASIEVNRRRRHIKTDRIDARKLRAMLIRYWVLGEKKAWRVLHIPTPAEEAARRVHRESERLKKERRQHLTRIRSLLVLHGINPRTVRVDPGKLRGWDGQALAESWQGEIRRELERLNHAEEQLKVLVQARADEMRRGANVAQQKAFKLARIKGVGQETAWNLSHEFFAWRDFKNRREVGSAAGLTGCPYNSGDSNREQGISKAGNQRVRHWMTELAWRWLKWQPESALSKWYQMRFGAGGQRQRRIGIVALCRKLLVAFWKYLEWELVPEGVIMAKAG